MVDGETYECVKSFCYLGDILDGDGGADLAATTRIRNGWVKFRELFPFLTSRAPSLEMIGRVYASCVRSSMTYGSETRPLLADVGLKFERAEMQMIRLMCGVSMKDGRTTTPACTWWNRPEEDPSSGKLESTHPSRTSVKYDQVLFVSSQSCVSTLHH